MYKVIRRYELSPKDKFHLWDIERSLKSGKVGPTEKVPFLKRVASRARGVVRPVGKVFDKTLWTAERGLFGHLLKHPILGAPVTVAGGLALALVGGHALGAANRVRQRKLVAREQDFTRNPLRPHETIVIGPESRRGVWRQAGSRKFFLEVPDTAKFPSTYQTRKAGSAEARRFK